MTARKNAGAAGATASRGLARRSRPGVEQQRETILAAAVSLFARQGSAATSVSDICRGAQVSRDTFYRCFADRDELVARLYDTAVNEHMQAVMRAPDLDYGDRDWLHRAFDRTIDAILEQHEIACFLFVESADPNSHAHTVIDRAYDAVARRMRRWCRQRYGAAPELEYFKALLVATQWLVHNAIQAGMRPADVERAKRAAERLFYGAFAALEGPPGERWVPRGQNT